MRDGEKISKPPYVEQEPKRWKSLFLETVGDIQNNVIFAGDFPELMWWTLYPVNNASLEIQKKVQYENPKTLFGVEW